MKNKSRAATSTIGVVIMVLLVAIAITATAAFVFDLTSLYDSEPQPDVSINQEYERISDDTYRVEVLTEDLSDVEYAIVTTNSEDAVFQVSRFKELDQYDNIPQNAGETRVLNDSSDGAIIASEGDEIVVTGLKEGDEIQLYSANGEGEEVYTNEFNVESLRGNEVDYNESSEPFDGDGSYFDVSIDSTNDPVDEREDLDVSSTITNTGNSSDVQFIELRDPYGRVVDSVEVSLGPGNSTSTSLTWSTNLGDAGDRTISVHSLNDSDSERVKINRSNIIAEPFIMTVDSTEGVSGYDEFQIYTGGSESYTVIGDSVTGGEQRCSGDCLVQFDSPGVHQIEIHTRDPFHYQSNDGDWGNLEPEPKEAYSIQSVDQWGEIEWSSFEKSFAGTRNMTIEATDAPDLSQVTNMRSAFHYATSIEDPKMDHWDVSNVEEANAIFTGAENFNSDISSWDTSSMVDMSLFFSDAHSFNQDISSWDTSNTKEMHSMFHDAYSFNNGCESGVKCSSLSWDTSSVESIGTMFADARSFNQDLSSWDTSNVDDMEFMFENATSFNGDITTWDTSNVENMRFMFSLADNFNQDISGWDTSNVEDMNVMFNLAKSFDQEIGSWNVSSVQNMSNMFEEATRFDADLSSWCVPQIDSKPRDFDRGAGFDGQTELHPEWGGDCNDPFIITVNTSVKNTATNDKSFRIQTGDGSRYKTISSSEFDYSVNWSQGSASGLSDDYVVEWDSPGTYQVKISGKFPHLEYEEGITDPEREALKIQTIEQWGDIEWKTFRNSFRGAENLESNFGSETPDLSNVESMHAMFRWNTQFNGDLSNWNVRNVKNFKRTFNYAKNFDSDLSGWDTSNAVDMEQMFHGAENFDSDVSSWDTSNVIDMRLMFRDTDFNPDVSGWDVGNVESIDGFIANNSRFNQNLNNWDTSSFQDTHQMFFQADSFNSDLDNWDTSNIQKMDLMFAGASNFNGDVTNWDTSNVEQFYGMFSDADSFDQDISSWNVTSAEESTPGYSNGFDSFLKGADSFSYDLTPWCVEHLDGEHITQFGIEESRQPNWGEPCSTTTTSGDPFKMTVDTTIAGETNNDQFRIQTGDGSAIRDLSDSNFNYTAVWDSGSVSRQSDDYTIEFGEAGVHQIEIYGDFPHVEYYKSKEANKIISIDQWGDVNWKSFENSFTGASNLEGNFSDEPDLSQVYSTKNMFRSAENFDADLSSWNVSNIQKFNYMFFDTKNFNSDLSGWDISNARTLSGMFWGAESFDSDLSPWDTSNVLYMDYIFAGIDYNPDVSGWDMSNVRKLNGFASQNAEFNQNLNDWDTSNFERVDRAFAYSDSFNSDLDNWDTSNVWNMKNMFLHADSFNGDVTTWETSNVEKMAAMFDSAPNFNQDIRGWNVTNVEKSYPDTKNGFDKFLNGADSFTYNLSNWCVEHLEGENITEFGIPESRQPNWGETCY
jgi:surface protein